MKYSAEIEKKLRPRSKCDRADHDAHYLNTKYKCLGTPVPEQRKIARERFSFERGSEQEVMNAWKKVWNEASSHDAMSVALFVFDRRRKSGKNNLKTWKLLKTWVSKIDNWAHSDYLSIMFADMLEKYPKEVLPTLKSWNKSQDPWKIRVSLVSLMGYAQFRKKILPFKTMISFVKPHLSHDHIYVQKAVGWTLRELYRVYPSKTIAFLKSHAKDIPTGGFSASIEKCSEAEKSAIKKSRKSR